MGNKDFEPSRFTISDTEHRMQVVDQKAQQENKLGGLRQGHKNYGRQGSWTKLLQIMMMTPPKRVSNIF